MFKTLKIFSMIALALFSLVPAVSAQQRGDFPAAAEQPKARGIIVRAAFWRGARSRNTEALFYKDGREYLPFQITEMAFLKAYDYSGPVPMQLFRKASEEEIETRKANGVPKNDLEYIEFAKIPLREGMKEVGVLVPGDIRTAQPAIFDFSEAAFPEGSLLMVNMTPLNIFGYIDLADRNDPDCGKYERQTFKINKNGIFCPRPVKMRTILEVLLAKNDEATGKPQRLFASQLIMFPNMRSVVFILPEKDKKGRDRTSVVTASVSPLPRNFFKAPENESPDGKPGVPADGKRKPEKEKKKPVRRRV